MNIRQYARAKQKPIGPLKKLIRAVLHALGVPVTPYQTNEVALRLYRPVLRAREHNRIVAVRYLEELDVPRLDIPTPRDYPLEALTSTIERVVSEVRIVNEPITRRNRAETLVIERTRGAIEGPIIRQALEPAREMVSLLGEDEEKPHYGWARVLRGAYSCSFCAMLASRGAVYTSKAAAEGRGGPMNVYHTRGPDKRPGSTGAIVGGDCDCEAVQVFDGVPWEGEAAWLALEDLWEKRNEKDPNPEGKQDPRNVFRRVWEGKIRAGDDMSKFLPESLQPKAGAA